MTDGTCRWQAVNCKFDGTNKCAICFTIRQFFKPKTGKKKQGLRQHAQRQDKRMGSAFEAANHKRNQADIKATESNMTVNSGATRRQKGDENITGLIRIMQELKTQMPDRKGGTKSFTLKREWFDKLHSEALQHGFEFWYLLFAFSEDEGVNPAGERFVVAEEDVFSSMVQSMISDRRRADVAAQQLDLVEKEAAVIKAENTLLIAKIAYLEAKLTAESPSGPSAP